MQEQEDGDADEEDAEDDLEQPLVDPRQPAGADPRADDRAGDERDRRTDPDLARDPVGRDARDADRDDRPERGGVGLALAVPGPEHEQRHHDDPAADAEQAREEPAEDADRDQLTVDAQKPGTAPGATGRGLERPHQSDEPSRFVST